jgi:predicted dehydrogenase
MNLCPNHYVPRADAAKRLLGMLLSAWWWLIAGWAAAAPPAPMATNAPENVRLITLEPGHFHAALFQKESLPGLAETVHVYSPLNSDLLLHLDRVAHFNARPQNPTRWKMEIHTSPDCMERLLTDRPGNVVVISGRNQGKIERVGRLLEAGLHVLADKPWIIEPEDLPKLESALATAGSRGVIGYDAMTQRFEISCLLQKELVNDAMVFGERLAGSQAEPAVEMESVHYLLKEVAGVPSRRPAWFFDTRQQGEGLTDVGTHLVDLVQWMLFPGQSLRLPDDVSVLDGRHWPTTLSQSQFQRVTGEPRFPEFLKPAVKLNASGDDQLDYFANNSVSYTLRGIHVRLTVRWEFAPAAGAKDSETAIFRGSRARIEVRQGSEQRFQAEIYVIPNQAEGLAEAAHALRRRVELLQTAYPGLSFEREAGRLRLVIPEGLRIGHEEHFALLTRQFLGYVRNPRSLREWEKPNMLAKYYVTTKGVELARSRPSAGPVQTPSQ